MTCAEFEACFDQYVDETLDAAMMNSCSCHISKCRPCDKEVTRWQQTRILLSTAVADLSTAVDVSSVRGDVFAALGFADDAASREAEVHEMDKRQSATREPAYDRSASRRGAGRTARRAASGERRSTFGAAMRFVSAATVSAIAAAAAVMVISPSPQGTGPAQQFASTKPAVVSGASIKPASLARAAKRNSFHQEPIAPVAYSSPPLARPEVSHVEGIEPAPGQQAATWVQPRTGARVIWVENRGGTPVRTAGLSR